MTDKKYKAQIKQLLQEIIRFVNSAPVAENNEDGVMHSTLCVYCNKPSLYLFLGNSLCRVCFQINKINKYKRPDDR